MCIIKNCYSQKNICLEHAMQVDDIVEILIDEQYTIEKIYRDLKNLSTENSIIYTITRNTNKSFINAYGYWDLIAECISKNLYVLKNYRDRIILEECVINNQLLDIYMMVANHIYKDFFSIFVVKNLF